MASKRLLWFLTLLVVVMTVCVSFSGVTSTAPFSYDEADYMYAGTQGFWANYSDRNAMPLVEFVRKGVELARDKSRRVSMSQYVRSTGDISFYRHYHGPVYAYWIVLCRFFGAQSEVSYRASGLILHALGSIAIFWLFLWVFPELPAAAAFIAAVMFAMNRTAIFTATMITQHVVFEILAILSLFLMARYLQTQDSRWWYSAAAVLGASFATVEISIVLAGALAVSIVLAIWRQGLHRIASVIGAGVLVSLVALLVLWPKGLLTLNALKGYLYLAYIAIYRKTFSPIGPLDLWKLKFTQYPLEFVLPFAALAAVGWNFRRSTNRQGALPFLIYTGVFLIVTTVITVPYTHYHGTLMAALSVVTGIAIGTLAKSTSAKFQIPALAVVAGSLTLLDAGYYTEMAAVQRRPSENRDAMEYIQRIPRGSNGIREPLYVPYTMVPTLHYYHPDLVTIGYDSDWSTERLAKESLAAAPARILCKESFCRQIRAEWPTDIELLQEPVGQSSEADELSYSMLLRKP